MEPLDIEGEWWLPGKSKEAYSGKLVFDPPSGGVLFLTDSFGEDVMSPTPVNHIIVNGISHDKEKYTLLYCREFSFVIDLRKRISKYFVGIIIKGWHFTNVDEIKFNVFYVSFRFLEQWIGGNPIVIDATRNSLRDSEIVGVSYMKPRDNRFNLDADNICITWKFYGKREISGIKVYEKAYFKIQTDEPMSIKEIRSKYIIHFQQFLTFAIGQRVFPKEIIATYNGNNLAKEVVIYYKSGYSSDDSIPTMLGNSLICYDDIKNKLDSLLSNWIMFCKENYPITDMYFGALFNPSLYVQNVFLSLTQVIESYPRYTKKGTYINSNKWKRIRNKMLSIVKDEISSEFMESLQHKTEHLHEYSLRKKLKQIVNESSEAIKAMMDRFNLTVDDLCFMRNVIIHPSFVRSDLERRDRLLEYVHEMTDILLSMIKYLIMRKIGFSKSKINQRIKNTMQYNYYMCGMPRITPG